MARKIKDFADTGEMFNEIDILYGTQIKTADGGYRKGNTPFRENVSCSVKKWTPSSETETTRANRRETSYRRIFKIFNTFDQDEVKQTMLVKFKDRLYRIIEAQNYGENNYFMYLKCVALEGKQ